MILFGRITTGRSRALSALLLVFALGLLLAITACAGEDDPTPTPTPPPTSTPEPTPTPPVGPTASLADLFLTDTTLGSEVMSRLSEAEADCVSAAIGEDVYATVLGLPIRGLIGQAGAGGAGSFLRCLTEDNLILVGEVLIDSHHGRTDIETRECRVAVGRANPDVIRIRFASLRGEMETLDAEALLSSAKEQFDCLNTQDRANLFARLTTTLDADDTFTGQDIVDMLPEEEVSCLRERIGEEQLDIFLNSTVTDAFQPSPFLLDCMALESKTRLFAAFTSSRLKGLQEVSVLCMANFVAGSPNILALGFGVLDVHQLEESELARLGDEAAKLFNCLESEEIIQLLTLPAVVGQ